MKEPGTGCRRSHCHLGRKGSGKGAGLLEPWERGCPAGAVGPGAPQEQGGGRGGALTGLQSPLHARGLGGHRPWQLASGIGGGGTDSHLPLCPAGQVAVPGG